MHRTTPRVFLVGRSAVVPEGMHDYLKHVGTKWLPPVDVRDGDLLAEFMGRLCYRSWEPGLNANVTRIREDSKKYIENILSVKHGSVLEHPVLHLVFANVSRVFTHELVRHRAGMAYSQESLRFVRLDDLGLWLPPEIEHHPDLVALFEKTFRDLGELQLTLAKTVDLDSMPFSEKKKYTSAMRRVAPIGLATTIGVTANARALRHIAQMRSAASAEAEIRLVMDQLIPICQDQWPHMFQDFYTDEEDGWRWDYDKV